jgi:hypothetical protein
MSGSVFISYVRDDAEAVQRLVRDLSALGVSIWLDRESIKPGEPWKVAIRAALVRGSCFVACFCASSYGVNFFGARTPLLRNFKIATCCTAKQ